MGLPRRTSARDGIYEKVEVRVYDSITKEIVFTGGQREAADFLKASLSSVSQALRKKCKIKKRYAIRFKKESDGQA